MFEDEDLYANISNKCATFWHFNIQKCLMELILIHWYLNARIWHFKWRRLAVMKLTLGQKIKTLKAFMSDSIRLWNQALLAVTASETVSKAKLEIKKFKKIV